MVSLSAFAVFRSIASSKQIARIGTSVWVAGGSLADDGSQEVTARIEHRVEREVKDRRGDQQPGEGGGSTS